MQLLGLTLPGQLYRVAPRGCSGWLVSTFYVQSNITITVPQAPSVGPGPGSVVFSSRTVFLEGSDNLADAEIGPERLSSILKVTQLVWRGGN